MGTSVPIEQCSCFHSTCRLKDPSTMNGFKSLALFGLLATGATAAGPNRKGKNLRGTFPFNQRNGNAAHAHAHDDHHAHAHAAEAVPARDARQRNRGGDDVALDIGSIAAAGERCIDKVVMVEETEYDDVIECKHSYSQKCHTTYTTDFEPQQEEECEENFIKNCFIEYRKIASEERVEFCHTPLVCDGEGPEECRTVYESQCETRYHEHDVEDDVVECETVQRRPATWSPKRSASMSPSSFLCSSLLRNVLTSPRRSAPGPAPTQGRFRSLLSRSGVTFQLPNLAWPNLQTGKENFSSPIQAIKSF